MKLFYNPSFSNNAYIDFKKKVFIDAQIVNTQSLINVIKLHSGLCTEVLDYGSRFVNYYGAMNRYMELNPNNIMASSFKVDKLNTAKKCLKWRDALASCGWNMKTPSNSERMKVLSGVEKYFGDKSCSQDALEVIEHIEKGCVLPEMEIETSFYYKDFSPLEVRLLEALRKRGVSIKVMEEPKRINNISRVYSILKGEEGVKLDLEDESFEIWNFYNKDEALKYLTLLDHKTFDVWINGDNREFDSWQRLEGKKLSGSVMKGRTQVSELLNMALQTFQRPLNLYSIVEWLNVNYSPLPEGFRKILSKKICKSGGYYNETCKDFIKEYLEKYPDTEEIISNFLPDITKPCFTEEEIPVSLLGAFIKSLLKWCRVRLATEKDESESLGFVIKECETMLMLLHESGRKTIPYSDIELMTSVLSTELTMEQYAPEAGCKNVIDSYGDICDDVDKVIWCDFFNGEGDNKLTYSFLSPREKDISSLSLWEADKERSYRRNLLLTPFSKTKAKLVLVTIDKVGSQDAPKNPIFIQLEKYFQDKKEPKNTAKNELYKFIKHKELDASLYKDIVKIDNRMEIDQEFVEIKNTDYIKAFWPDHQSYSSLENLIPHPLDYVIDNFVGFSEPSVDEVSDVATTKGLVAHKIIETLFGPSEAIKESGIVEYIRKEIKAHFNEVFEKTVQSQGAILLTEDNKLELQKFKKDVKENLDELLKAMEENDLHVIACEKPIGYSKDYENGKVLSHGKIGILDIKGEVDMLLKDSEGQSYIFDFKWTASTSRHRNLLKENKSVQLTLYKELVEKEMKSKVKVFYFLMPEGKFVSTHELKGSINLQQVLVDEDRRSKDLLKEIQNSYKYRMEEIFSGKLEETTGWSKADITYESKAEDEGLMPMDYFEGVKSGPYNGIGLIKNRKSGE